MNKVFKVIWSEARNAYVVVSEMAKSHGTKSCSTKKLLAMLIATGVMTCASMAPAMADNPAPNDKNVTIGKVAVSSPYVGQTGNVAIGEKALAWNGKGLQEALMDFGQGGAKVKSFWGIPYGAEIVDGTKLPGSIAIGKNTVARSGSTMIGDHGYTGKIGDITITPDGNGIMKYNNDVYSTTIGANSFNSGALASVTGVFSIASSKYDGANNKLHAVQNTGATIYGSMNSIESATSDAEYSGIASSVLGFANRTQNANAALIWGTGNEVTNSIENIGIDYNGWNKISVAEAQKKAIEAMQSSSKYAGGSVMAIGGGNKADYATYSELTGVQNKVTGTKAKAVKYDLVNGYQNTVSNASDVTVIGIKNEVTADGNKVIGDNHNVSGKDNVIFGSADQLTETTVNNAVVLGHNAKVTDEGGVALGAGSVADRANAVSVGSTGANRQIINVAAGTEGTDAVNVSQLQKVSDTANAGWNLSTNGFATEATNVKPGGYVDFSGDDENITVSKEENEYATLVKVNLNRDLNVDSVHAGDFFMNNDMGIGFGGSAYITKNGLNANDKVITNVAAGVYNTDAVNVGQLKKVEEVAANANKGWNLATNVKPGDYVDFSGDKNISVSHDGTKVQVELNKNIDVNYVQTNALNAKYNLSVGTANENGTVPFLVSSTGAFYAANNNFSVDKDGKVIATAGEIGNVVLKKGVYTGNSALRDGELYVGDASGNYSQITPKSAKLGQVTIDEKGNMAGVNSIQTNALNSKYNLSVGTMAENGIMPFLVNSTGAFYAANNNFSVDKDGKVIATAGEIGNVVLKKGVYTGNSALRDGELYVGDASGNYSQITTTGAKLGQVTIAADGKISGVAAGEADTDAVNVSQLNAVATEAGKHTTLSNGKNTTVESTVKDGQTDYKVNVAGDLTDITSVANGDSKINLNKDSIIISNGNKYFAITNSGIGMSYIGADYSAKSIMLGENGTTISGGLNVAGSKITGVAEGEVSSTSTDAINGSQLHAVATEAGKHTTLSNGKNTTVESTVKDGQTDYKVNVAGDLTDITSVANGDSKINLNKDSIIISNGNKYFAITNSGIGMSYIGADYSAKSIMLGENGTTISGGLNVAGSKITGVAEGVADTDAVNVGQLKEAVEAGNTDTHIKPGEYGVGADNTVNMDVVDKNGNKVDTVTIKDVAKASDVGNVNNIADDIKNGEGHTTVVDAVNNLNQKLDNKVGDLNYVEGGKGNYVTNGENTTTSIGKLDQALKDVADTANQGWNLSTNGGEASKVAPGKTVDFSGDKNIIISNDGTNVNVKLNEAIDVDTVKANTVTAKTVTTGNTVMNSDGVKVGADVSLNQNGLNVGKDVSVTATAVTAGKTSISDEGVKVGDKTYISADGLNANGQHITNVKAGEADTDAVNYGQLKDTNNRINGVENQVISNSNRINQLGNRVNKVGAGAAALAALHPMDFDPDDKLTFSAGYGNYGGENAAAIGAYYRPDEKVMFSVAGTVGNGENMVNAGVSFALDRTNHVSNSRTALAREVIDLRGQLAVMGAKMAKMEKAFGMLDETKTKLFPDVPANHWAYEYIAKLAGNGYIEGYPDGNFGGDRLMTRYEFAAMLYRAIEKGAALEEKIIKEFEPELGRIRVDRISGEDGDRDKIERVRVNDTKGERDHYGNKLAK